jgi:hypothetical protein
VAAYIFMEIIESRINGFVNSFDAKTIRAKAMVGNRISKIKMYTKVLPINHEAWGILSLLILFNQPLACNCFWRVNY